MKFKRRLTSGDLLLLELVFAIIFFCLTMSASMAVFGNAYEMSSKAESLDSAVRESNSAIEIIRSSATAEEIDSGFASSGYTGAPLRSYTKEYDNGKYRIDIAVSVTGNLYSAVINCYKQSDPETSIYDISVKHALSK